MESCQALLSCVPRLLVPDHSAYFSLEHLFVWYYHLLLTHPISMPTFLSFFWKDWKAVGGFGGAGHRSFNSHFWLWLLRLRLPAHSSLLVLGMLRCRVGSQEIERCQELLDSCDCHCSGTEEKGKCWQGTWAVVCDFHGTAGASI